MTLVKSKVHTQPSGKAGSKYQKRDYHLFFQAMSKGALMIKQLRQQSSFPPGAFFPPAP
jgi:hypothetical protein